MMVKAVVFIYSFLIVRMNFTNRKLYIHCKET